ncbi:MAG: exodeoxyribonuclease III [Thiomargarita sp.]|nr:exodeoxyribonuclease III [Thiomargarita sp.]
MNKKIKIATWNVNSLRVRLPHVLDFLKNTAPDILALQEIKMTDDKFPIEEIQAAGYHVLFSGQKTYNGVALLSRMKGNDVITDLPHLDDPQRRVLGTTYDNKLRVLNLYVPNGASLDSDKYQYKLNWFKYLHNYISESIQEFPHLILLGDFNIAPEDRDVYNPAAWKGKVIVSPPERAALRDLLSLGLHDTFRLFEQPPALFSWWHYRREAFARNMGLRIDFILASSSLSSHCTSCMIDIAPRGLERPSDHAPVVATFDL